MWDTVPRLVRSLIVWYFDFRAQKIQLLCSVMGMECAYDPDESYELTGDNVKKILAIHMRFRCNIPVVIMGETGCGKTRLIRYLCGLQTEGNIQELKNMLLMKVTIRIIAGIFAFHWTNRYGWTVWYPKRSAKYRPSKGLRKQRQAAFSFARFLW